MIRTLFFIAALGLFLASIFGYFKVLNVSYLLTGISTLLLFIILLLEIGRR